MRKKLKLASWELPKVKQLPPGYHKLPVIVTTKELERFKRSASLQPHGTYSEAIRRSMGMTPNPHRLRAALIDQAVREAEAEDAQHQTDNNEE